MIGGMTMEYETPNIEIIQFKKEDIFTVDTSTGNGPVGDGSDLFG